MQIQTPEQPTTSQEQTLLEQYEGDLKVETSHDLPFKAAETNGRLLNGDKVEIDIINLEKLLSILLNKIETTEIEMTHNLSESIKAFEEKSDEAFNLMTQTQKNSESAVKITEALKEVVSSVKPIKPESITNSEKNEDYLLITPEKGVSLKKHLEALGLKTEPTSDNFGFSLPDHQITILYGKTETIKNTEETEQNSEKQEKETNQELLAEEETGLTTKEIEELTSAVTEEQISNKEKQETTPPEIIKNILDTAKKEQTYSTAIQITWLLKELQDSYSIIKKPKLFNEALRKLNPQNNHEQTANLNEDARTILTMTIAEYQTKLDEEKHRQDNTMMGMNYPSGGKLSGSVEPDTFWGIPTVIH